MVPAGNKVKRLSSVNYTTKAIHDHHKKFGKETNKQNKEKIHESSKYIEMYVEKCLCENIKSI